MWLRDILFLTLPALLILGGIFFLIKQYFDFEKNKKLIEVNMLDKNKTIPMKLQAYERLALMLERIRIRNLWYRLATPGSDSMGLQKAMNLAIHQEFEHNLTQQIYVSESLWKIVVFAKDQQQLAISAIYTSDQAELKEKLFDIDNNASIDTALNAIRHEMQLFL